MNPVTTEKKQQRKKAAPALRAALFVVVLGVLLGAAGQVLRPKWTSWSLRDGDGTAAFYEQPEDTVEVLFLGASIVTNGFSPMEMYEKEGICAYNLGTDNQPVLASYYWLREAWERQSGTLKTVVLDATMLRRSPTDEFYRKSLAGMRMGGNKLAAVRNSSDSLEDFAAALLPVYAYHSRWKELDGQDFQFVDAHIAFKGYRFLTDSLISRLDDTEIGIPSRRADETAESIQLDPQALAYWEKTVEFCREKGLRLLLIKTPAPLVWSDGAHNAAAALATRAGVTFLDMNYDPWLEEIGFNNAADTVDGNHFNYYGMKKLSGRFGRYLIENGCAADIRGESRYAFLEEEREDYHRNILAAALREQSTVEDYLSLAMGQPEMSVFVTVCDDGAGSLSEEQRRRFRELGFGALSELAFRDVYVAVAENGRVVYEQRGDAAEYGEKEEPLQYTGLTPDRAFFALVSGNYDQRQARCTIGNTEYSPGARGINVTVYDQRWKRVVDSAVFDTYESGSREAQNIEEALARAVEADVPWESLPSAQQRLYLYNLRCADSRKAEDMSGRMSGTGLADYLAEFREERFLLMLAAEGDAAAALDVEERVALSALGLETLSALGEREAYVGAMLGGEVMLEERGAPGGAIERRFLGCRLGSGSEAVLVAGGSECSLNAEGIHVAVYDLLTGEVVHSAAFGPDGMR